MDIPNEETAVSASELDVTSWPINQHCQPSGYVYLAAFPEICVSFFDDDGEQVRIEYVGFAEDLVNAGIATAEMLRINCRPQQYITKDEEAAGNAVDAIQQRKGRGRVDKNGKKFGFKTWWVNVPISPRRRYSLTLSGAVSELPGAADAIAAYWARNDWTRRPSESPAPKSPAHRAFPDYLRLVK